MLEFKQRVIDTFLNEAISFFEEWPKCHFYKYKYMYDDHNLQFYLCRPVNYMFKPLISRYRLHAHRLNIETGRNYIQLLHVFILIEMTFWPFFKKRNCLI
jgi:hypothetical protein